MDENGNLPRHNGELCVWQFNFKEFKLSEDMYAQESIDLLKQSGIDFNVMQQASPHARTIGWLGTTAPLRFAFACIFLSSFRVLVFFTVSVP